MIVLLLLLLAQDAPKPLRFMMQHDTGAKDGRGARKLSPEEEQALAREFRALPGVKEVVVKDGVFSLTPGAPLRLSDLRAAGKKVPVEEGFHQILLNTLKLEGRVTLTLEVSRNRDKIKELLKAEEGPDGFTFKGTGADLPSVIKSICTRCGVEYRLFEVLKDVTWHR